MTYTNANLDTVVRLVMSIRLLVCSLTVFENVHSTFIVLLYTKRETGFGS